MALLCLGVANTAQAAPRTWHVPADFSTIQAGVDAASTTEIDTVLVSPGTYLESVHYNGKKVKVISEQGPAVTTISAPAGFAAASFLNGETVESVFSGFTVTCNASGIYLASASATITSNVIINCNGQGIDAWSSAAIIRGNRIVGNVSAGINLVGSENLLIEGNIIQSNNWGFTINGNGTGSSIIRNNLIQGNRGGGLTAFNHFDANISQNIIAENETVGIGCAVSSGGRGPYVVNNTIYGNPVGISADGLDGNSQIINNIVEGSPPLVIAGFNNVNSPIIQFNDFFSRTGAVFSGLITNLVGVAGNISADPWFACKLTDDFHLIPRSVCIDGGTNGAPLLTTTDFDGNTRLRDGDTNGSVKIDMGAFEFNALAAPAPCLFIICPSNIVVIAPAGQTSVAVTYSAPDATPSATVTSSPTSGSVFSGGTNIVTCTMTYGSNSLSCSFTITVIVPPFITSSVPVTTVSAGDTAFLTFGIQGTTPLRYYWSFEAVAVVGATNQMLVISNAQSVNAGFYRLTITNSAGSVTSSPALLRVTPASPSLTTQPASQSILSGSTFRLTFGATGSAPQSYSWYGPGGNLAGTNAVLQFTNAQQILQGNYFVIISNSYGSATSTVASIMITPSAPTISVQPLGRAVVAGSNVTFSVQASGSDPLVYQWQLEGTNLTGATAATIVRNAVQAADAGDYTVTVSNSFGAVTSQPATLIVRTPAQISQSPANQTAFVGANVSLSPTISGDSPIVYQWQYFATNLPGATSSSLLLTNVQSAQSGPYRLTVTNAYGANSSTAILTVFPRPGFVAAWGDNVAGQSFVPPGLSNIVKIAGGNFHTLTLSSDGSITGWGDNGFKEAVAPGLSNVIGVAAGGSHSVALLLNGNVFAWGDNSSGQTNVLVAATNVISVAAGQSHTLVLRADGTVRAWGDNSYGQSTIPGTLTDGVAIAAGEIHNLAIKRNGTLVGWGNNTYGQTTIPASATNIVAIAAGYLHSIALRADGTVVAWGDNTFGQTNIPPGITNAVAIAAGELHSLALLRDGRIIGWGDNQSGQLNIPNWITAETISSGYYHSLAISADPIPLVKAGLTGGQLVLSWTGPYVLQIAPQVTGTYQDIASSSPFTTNIITMPQSFFRLRR